MLALLNILQTIRANSPHEMPVTLYLAGSFHRKPPYLSLIYTNVFFVVLQQRETTAPVQWLAS
jgi:hypothetical protein